MILSSFIVRYLHEIREADPVVQRIISDPKLPVNLLFPDTLR